MADQYTIQHTFLDITDTALSANQTKSYESTNSNTTGNTITSSATGGDVVREITDIEIIPPEDVSGNFEDLREVWFDQDNKSTQHYLNLSGVGSTLMTPLHKLVYGGRHLALSLGEPLWKLIKRGAANMPLLNTTLKYDSTLSLNVHTIAGVTGAGSGGWRVICKGYEYTDAELADLAKGWTNAVSVQTEVRRLIGKPPLNFTYTPAGPLSLATFTSYPGGIKQGAIKINPYWHGAYNNLATAGTSPFTLTNFNELAGGTGHVEDTYQDLGLKFGATQDAFLLKGVGIQAVQGASGTPGQNLSRFGFYMNGDYIPQVTGNEGIFVTPGVNDYAFGESSACGLPQRGLYVPIPRLLGEMLVYQDNFAPFIGGDGSPIPADAVFLGMFGTLIER